MNDPERIPPDEDAVAMLVARMMQTTGTLSLIVNHMAEWSSSERAPADSRRFDEVLAGLLQDALEPLADRHPADEIAAAAGLLDRAQELICEELYLVPRDPPPCSRRRTPRRARR